MRDVPIRRLMVSDFRRVEGNRELPFDAPVVLIHGPNGTGKTSILSALELALTGGIRSMERQSDRYRAHLPFLGQAYATVRADVAEYLQSASAAGPITVGGARLEGAPAFDATAAKFFIERCYLDQASLGRLLDIYQTREGNEQTALEIFVNELLGLEKLDALRDGLRDANDLRLMKKLAVGVDEAERNAKSAAAALKEQAGIRAGLRAEIGEARVATREAAAELGCEIGAEATDLDLVSAVRSASNDDSTSVESAGAVSLREDLVGLGGRISAFLERPVSRSAEESGTALAAAIFEEEAWQRAGGAFVRAWEVEAERAGVVLTGEPGIAVEQALNLSLQTLSDSSEARTKVELVDQELKADLLALEERQARLAGAQEHSSALVEALAAVRPLLADTNVCPVCDRDFREIAGTTLQAHVDAKLTELANHGHQLIDLRNERDEFVARVRRLEREQSKLLPQVLSYDQQQSIERRIATLERLASQVDEIELARTSGAALARVVRDARQLADDLEAASTEERHISTELDRYAALLGVDGGLGLRSFPEALSYLLDIANSQIARAAAKAGQCRSARDAAARLAEALERESSTVQGLADVAEGKKQWDERFAEAKRRQAVAKELREAATQARTNIVHRVFTESLNQVWETVFTRLAPTEIFIPRFGIPSATKKTFDIKLETTLRSGESGGPPQMMLSAGNLNTAALSLFLALHLAVEPIVPCLVFDDPVQAMDEVHVAQFAGLIRLLSKQTNRQVIIAVHERELFDYLSLELSPAFEGDELITIELGERASDQDQGVRRHQWVPDVAIAN